MFDFSLGNPNAPPPPAFFDALQAVAAERNASLHRYMPNAGFDETRAAVARFVSAEYRMDVDAASVILTSGAAGGMNVVLRAICNPGDEVITLAPYFPEYRFYIEQAGARMVLVQTDGEFQPDLAAIRAVLTERTRAIIINTPNNPSGAVYTAESCRGLGEVLAGHDRPDRPLYIVCDDPYRRIIYDLDWCPTPAQYYPRTLIVSSYSKDLSIAGERAGYIAVPPTVPEKALLLAALTMLNRTLGFVNASAVMQRVIARCPDCAVRRWFLQAEPRSALRGAASVRVRAGYAPRGVVRVSKDADRGRSGVRGASGAAPGAGGAGARVRPAGVHAAELLRGSADDRGWAGGAPSGDRGSPAEIRLGLCRRFRLNSIGLEIDNLQPRGEGLFGQQLGERLGLHLGLDAELRRRPW